MKCSENICKLEGDHDRSETTENRVFCDPQAPKKWGYFDYPRSKLIIIPPLFVTDRQ